MSRGSSAGVLLFRRRGCDIEVLLVHPGGPFWRNRDIGAWQLPKGAIETGETPLQAALREVEEEIGLTLSGRSLKLGRVRQAGGKIVEAFAIESDFDVATLNSITFEMEWPPRSGIIQFFPEVDAAQWMTMPRAREMILPSQSPFLDRLVEAVPAQG